MKRLKIQVTRFTNHLHIWLDLLRAKNLYINRQNSNNFLQFLGYTSLLVYSLSTMQYNIRLLWVDRTQLNTRDVIYNTIEYINQSRELSINCQSINQYKSFYNMRWMKLLTYACWFLPRCMECRRGLAMRILSVRASVRPSVRLSHAWIVTKR